MQNIAIKLEEQNLELNNGNQQETTPTKKKSLKERQRDGRQQKLYPCDKCKRKLKSEMSFKKHQEMHDNKEQIYKCHICKQGK